jgi:hypothetical protein
MTTGPYTRNSMDAARTEHDPGDAREEREAPSTAGLGDGADLPDEQPSDVVDLAAHFPGTDLLIVGDDRGRWPAILTTGAPSSDCFTEVDIGRPADSRLAGALNGIHVFRLACP